MAEWVTVGTVEQVPEGGVFVCVVGGEEIAIVGCDGTFYAVNDICSHAYSHMSEGEVDCEECTIECPLHGSTFDLRTGKPRTLPATMPIATYQVQVVDGVVQIAVA